MIDANEIILNIRDMRIVLKELLNRPETFQIVVFKRLDELEELAKRLP
jgi:hypothetical protein